MEPTCVACNGSGYEEHIDRTLPPPPCRLCCPEEARLHLTLAHDTRHVAAMQRKATYRMLRDAIMTPAQAVAAH